MKAKKILAAGLAATFMLLAGCSSSAPVDQNVGEPVSRTEASTALGSQETVQLSDNLTDYQIQLNGMVYDLPMTEADFEKCGWSIDQYEDDDEMVSSGRYIMKWYKAADGSRVLVYIINFSTSEQLYSDCYVSGFEISADDINFDISNIVMAKGITFGVSTQDDIVEAFGDSTKEYDEDYYRILEYKEDGYNYVKFYVYKDINALKKVILFTNEEPENLSADEVYDEKPDIVINYQQPTGAGSSITSGVIELDGVLYQMPVPVCELMKNGWQIDTSSSDSAVSGRDNGYVTLTKGEQKIENICVLNYTEKNVPVENCVIENISTGRISFTVPGYLNEDMTLDEIKALAAAANAETEEDDYYFKVTFKNPDNALSYVGLSFEKSRNEISYYLVNVTPMK